MSHRTIIIIIIIHHPTRPAPTPHVPITLCTHAPPNMLQLGRTPYSTTIWLLRSVVGNSPKQILLMIDCRGKPPHPQISRYIWAILIQRRMQSQINHHPRGNYFLGRDNTIDSSWREIIITCLLTNAHIYNQKPSSNQPLIDTHIEDYNYPIFKGGKKFPLWKRWRGTKFFPFWFFFGRFLPKKISESQYGQGSMTRRRLFCPKFTPNAPSPGGGC